MFLSTLGHLTRSYPYKKKTDIPRKQNIPRNTLNQRKAANEKKRKFQGKYTSRKERKVVVTKWRKNPNLAQRVLIQCKEHATKKVARNFIC